MKKRILFLIAATLVTPSIGETGKDAPRAAEVYDMSAGRPVQIAAKKTGLPLVVYGESAGKTGTFIPSGYMGDAVALKMISTDFSAPISDNPNKKGSTALKIKYTPKGPAGWAGIFWMTPANNWAKIKGAGYDLSSAKKLTFWMKGEKGGERVAAIKFGGIIGPYPDTDSGSMEGIKLKDEWTRYEIDLTGKDLRHIVGGFVFSVTRSDNPRGATFYLDEIRFEGDPEAAPLAEAAPAVPEAKAYKPLSETRFVVPFPHAKTVDDPAFKDTAQQVIELATRHPETKVIVEGHTDNAGPEDVNLRLSLERAKVVADYFEKNGIAKGRISIKGYGPERPLTPNSNDTPEGRQKNRRVEVCVVAAK